MVVTIDFSAYFWPVSNLTEITVETSIDPGSPWMKPLMAACVLLHLQTQAFQDENAVSTYISHRHNSGKHLPLLTRPNPNNQHKICQPKSITVEKLTVEVTVIGLPWKIMETNREEPKPLRASGCHFSTAPNSFHRRVTGICWQT